MQLTIEQPKLAALLSRVTGVIEKRNTIPVLSNVVINADGSLLGVRGTDLNSDAIAVGDADVSEAGKCTVRAEMLQGIVNRLAKGSLVTLAHNGDKLTVSSGKSSFNLATLPVDDFPDAASDNYTTKIELPSHELARLLDLTAFAMSTEETRYYLNGVYLHEHKGRLRAVSTDGHRLAMVDGPECAEFAGVIIPRKAVHEVQKLLKDADTVNVSLTDTKAKFDFGTTELVTKTIDGTFPDYTRVIPAHGQRTATASAADMKEAAARVALVATERMKSVRLTFRNGSVSLEVNGNDGDKAVDEIECEYSGDEFTIIVNARYLDEALKQLNGDNVVFNMSEPITPMRIAPGGDEDTLFVVMPLRN